MTEMAARLPPAIDPAIATGLWHLAESREWTLSYLEGLEPPVLDLTPVGHRHSVATLLYHVAVFEVDWVFVDVMGNEYDMVRRIPECPPEISSLLLYPLLEEDESYAVVQGEPLDTHLERLAVIRQGLIAIFSAMDLAEYRRPRPSGDGTVTPEWVLMHLARHESEHRGQMWEAKVAAENELAGSA